MQRPSRLEKEVVAGKLLHASPPQCHRLFRGFAPKWPVKAQSRDRLLGSAPTPTPLLVRSKSPLVAKVTGGDWVVTERKIAWVGKKP